MRLKHFPTGLLRCGISKRKAKLFVTALIVAATAQTCFAQNTIEGVQDLVGKTITDLRSGTTDVDKYPHEDLTKIFFLYNVKTGQFFNAGGYWGTEGTMRDYPLKLWAKTPGSRDNTIRFAMELKTNQGEYIKWAKGSDPLDSGVFIDRYINNKEYSSDDWFFTPTNDGKNTYKIYTKKYNKWNTSLLDTPCYMCVCGDIVDAKTADEISSNKYTGYDEWRIFSMDQIVALQQENLDALKNSLELSFKLKCAGFSRGDNELNSWKMYPWGLGTGAIARFGLEHLYDKPTLVANPKEHITLDRAKEFHVDNLSKSNTYSFKYDNTTTTTDKTFKEKDDYQRYLGKYFCADVKNVRGIIYQEVEIKNNGVYVVECKGYSNTEKAKLFATIVTMGADGKWTDTGDGQIRSTVLSQISNMPAAEQTALHTSEKNMDYAGQNFYNSRKYINNVLVNVEGVDASNRKAIRFGIMVGSKDDATPVDGEWTVFDDFRLLFANKVANEDLVLDEDRDNLSYLTHETTYRNRTLHLNKTLVKDKWNSLVLPVDLTIDQFRNAFGANARLAKLTKLAANEIMFESDKNLDNLVTTPDKNTIVLEAYKPYIIFPTKVMNNETNAKYTAKLTKKANGSAAADNFEYVTIKANHIEIPNVTMKYTEDGSVFKNDLTNMNTNNWTSTLNTGDGTITAYGTFARTFGEAEQNTETGVWEYSRKDNILPNRDNLIGSYFFYEGNMYYSNERARGLRGFSCWFKPNTGTKATLFLDGVQQEGGLTDIGEITFEPQNESMERFANGIYNMNGQLVKAGTSMAGMPKGIYIVNGKKVVVR
ncbi:hypothetical protein [Prevotella pectinovora]|uniref:hypothetical protein n=1 Tax=Prevotella pectinovora TaxID=1602169 RepID=UPI002FD8DCB8